MSSNLPVLLGWDVLSYYFRIVCLTLSFTWLISNRVTLIVTAHTHTHTHTLILEQLREDLGFTSEKTPTTSNQSMKAMNVDDVINEVVVAYHNSVYKKSRPCFFLETIICWSIKADWIFFAQILLDAIGYMGLFTLFMAMDNGKGLGVEDLPVKNMPELHWGDTESRWGKENFFCVKMNIFLIQFCY